MNQPIDDYMVILSALAVVMLGGVAILLYLRVNHKK